MQLTLKEQSSDGSLVTAHSEIADSNEQKLLLPFTELSHMSETAGWVTPVNARESIRFVQAAFSQKDYVRGINETRRKWEAEDIVSTKETGSTLLSNQYFAPRKGRDSLDLFKYNSCSTLYVDGTLSSSDLLDTCHSVALALSCILRYNYDQGLEIVTYDIFSEIVHPTMPDYFQSETNDRTSEDMIFEFIYPLFWTLETNSECVVMTLIYIERMLEYTGVTIHGLNWGRVILGGLLLATKVWTDDRIYNADFLRILSDIGVNELNVLEVWYIKAISFNLGIKASTYAKYYFELRHLSERSSRKICQKPLTIQQATILEAKTLYTEDSIRGFRKKLGETSPVSSREQTPTASIASLSLTGGSIFSSNFVPRSPNDTALKRAQSDLAFSPIGSPAMVM